MLSVDGVSQLNGHQFFPWRNIKKKKKKTLHVLQAMVSELQWNMMASAQKMSVEKKEVPNIGKRWADSLEA